MIEQRSTPLKNAPTPQQKEWTRQYSPMYRQMRQRLEGLNVEQLRALYGFAANRWPAERLAVEDAILQADRLATADALLGALPVGQWLA